MVVRRITVTASLVAVVLLGACSSGTPQVSTSPTDDASAPPGTPTSLTEGTVTLGSSVWFSGFKLTLESAALVIEDSGAYVDIATLFENQGASNATLNATLNLSSGTQNYSSDFSRTDLPEVPGRTTGSGQISFSVDDAFSFDEAVLTIGNPDNNQAIVPFGLGGTLVDLAPAPLQVKGSGRGGELKVRVRGGELRADIPERHDQVEVGHRALTLDIDITYLGDFEGGYAFGPNNLALTLPDGTTVAVDDGPIELLRAGTTLPDQQVRFIVRDPAPGTYDLVVIDDTIDERGTFTFTIA